MPGFNWGHGRARWASIACGVWFRSNLGSSRVSRRSDLVIANDDLFGNVMRGGAFDNQNRMARVGGPLDSHEWMLPVQTLNAYSIPR